MIQEFIIANEWDPFLSFLRSGMGECSYDVLTCFNVYNIISKSTNGNSAFNWKNTYPEVYNYVKRTEHDK